MINVGIERVTSNREYQFDFFFLSLSVFLLLIFDEH